MPGDEQPGKKPADTKLTGYWFGTIQSGTKQLRVLFKIKEGESGGLTATMNSLDRDGVERPLDEATFRDEVLRLVLKNVGDYEGKLDAEKREVVGNWRQGKLSVPLTLRWIDKPPELRRPQEPKKPYPYEEREVVVENADAKIKLAGTLTLSKAPGPHPAVLLVLGSGPQDRNETVFGHRPFLVLADHLTRRGVAVLRVDDRGVGGSTSKFAGSTTEDFVSDALAGVNYLRGLKEIDPKRVGLIGHSEGGIIASLAAARTPDVAFIVLLAAPGLTGEEVSYLQSEAMLKAAGAPDSVIAWNRSMQERLFAVLKAEKDEAAAKTKMRQVVRDELAKMVKERGVVPPTLQADLDAMIEKLSRPWFRYFLTLDPRTSLKQVKCPVLAVLGERDTQVTPKENAAAIEAALKAGRNRDFAVKTLPKLNHLLQTSESGATSEYGKIEETVSPAVLELLAEWVGKRVGRA